MTVLTRDQILAIDDRQFEFVKVPEWSPGDPEGGVWVWGLSGTERDEFERAMISEKKDKRGRVLSAELNMRNLRAKLVALSARDSSDADAQPIFVQNDVIALGGKSASALQRIYSVAQRLSGLSDEDVEELTAELGNDQSGDSGSPSPHTLVTRAWPLPSDTSAAGSSASGTPSTEENPSAESA